MRDSIVKNLSSAIEAQIADALVESYEALMASYASGDLDRCLTKAGLFVEHALRAVESIRTGAAPPEIKSVAATVRALEADTTLPDSLRHLIPRVAYGMIYGVRSKRGVVHVKEVDPRRIDASLATHAASWVLAEFLRLYHSGDEVVVAMAIDALMRTHIPFVESFGAERVVTRKVPCRVELLLLLAGAVDEGIDRRALGRASKFPPSRISKMIKGLREDRYVHQTQDGKFHITGPGEQFLAEEMVARK